MDKENILKSIDKDLEARIVKLSKSQNSNFLIPFIIEYATIYNSICNCLPDFEKKDIKEYVIKSMEVKYKKLS